MRDDFHKKFLIGLLILLDQSKKNHTKSNLMYLCIFMLLSISASRELANALNEPFLIGHLVHLGDLLVIEGDSRSLKEDEILLPRHLRDPGWRAPHQ